jgi:hypothetical protein
LILLIVKPGDDGKVGAQAIRDKDSTQGDKVAGVTFDPAGNFQLEEEGGHGGG